MGRRAPSHTGLLILILSHFALSACAPLSDNSASPKGVNPRDHIFASRLAEEIALSRTLPVTYDDSLGEGPGHWDSDPRSGLDRVNCMSWWQTVLAKTYSSINPVPYRREWLETRLLDLFRYHQGVPSFGNRKHFLDVAMEADPGPFRRLDLQECSLGAQKRRPFEPDFGGWKKEIGYTCNLTDEQWLERHHVEWSGVEAIPLSRLKQCLGQLKPDRHYLALPIASPLYLKIYGSRTGRMAQVHAWLISKKTRVTPPAIPGAEPKKGVIVAATHASTTSGKVETFTLWPDLLDDIEIFDGLVLYAIDPDWDWRKALHESDQRITRGEGPDACERNLAGRAGKPLIFKKIPKKPKLR